VRPQYWAFKLEDQDLCIKVNKYVAPVLRSLNPYFLCTQNNTNEYTCISVFQTLNLTLALQCANWMHFLACGWPMSVEGTFLCMWSSYTFIYLSMEVLHLCSRCVLCTVHFKPIHTHIWWLCYIALDSIGDILSLTDGPAIWPISCSYHSLDSSQTIHLQSWYATSL
jgi:hypothetical protein